MTAIVTSIEIASMTKDVIIESTNVTGVMAASSVCRSAGEAQRMRQATVDDVIGAACMSVVTLTSVLANAVLLVVLLRTPSLRFQLSNVFVINLCVIDLLSAVLVQPVFVASHLLPVPLLDRRLSAVHGCVASWLMFASILATCTISVERFYSIRLPMHHAAHLTLGRACAVIASYVWFQAGVLATPPAAYGWSVFLYRYPDDDFDDHNERGACGTDVGETEYIYVLVASLLCFLVPGAIVTSMYCAIYRVARQAARQVHPAPMPSRTRKDEILQANSPGMEVPKDVASVNPLNDSSTTYDEQLDSERQWNCHSRVKEEGRDPYYDSDGSSRASNHKSLSAGKKLTTADELTAGVRLLAPEELLANERLPSTGEPSDDKTGWSVRGKVLFSEEIAKFFLLSENSPDVQTANDDDLQPVAEVRADLLTSIALETTDRSVPGKQTMDGGSAKAAEGKTKASSASAAPDEQIVGRSAKADCWMQMQNNGHTIPLPTGLGKEMTEKAESTIKKKDNSSKEITYSGPSKHVAEVHIGTHTERVRGRDTAGGGSRGGGRTEVRRSRGGYQRKELRRETGAEKSNKETPYLGAGTVTGETAGAEVAAEEVEGVGERRAEESSTRETGASTAATLTIGPMFLRPPVTPPSLARSAPLPVKICQEELTARHRDSNTKALLALTVILSTFLLLWSPYFIVNLYLSFFFRRRLTLAGPSSSALSLPLALRAIELSTRWLGLSASTVNVFVYGWMNRSIRDELCVFASDVGRFLRRRRGRHRCSDNTEEANEDFFQFLERTSTGYRNHHHHSHQLDKPHQVQSSASSSSSPNYASSSSSRGAAHRSVACTTTTTSRASSSDAERSTVTSVIVTRNQDL